MTLRTGTGRATDRGSHGPVGDGRYPEVVAVTSERRRPDPSRGSAKSSPASGEGERRRGLLDIAIRVIGEQGLEACTFRTLAREAGASTMTYTYVFGTRDSLIEAIIERVFERAWHERGFDVDDDADDPLGKLRRAANLAIQDGEEIDPFQRTLDRFVWEAAYSESTARKIDELDGRMAARYHRLIDLAKEQGQIDTELGNDDLLMMFWSLGDGLNIQRYAHPDEMPPERLSRLFNLGLDHMLGLGGPS